MVRKGGAAVTVSVTLRPLEGLAYVRVEPRRLTAAPWVGAARLGGHDAAALQVFASGAGRGHRPAPHRADPPHARYAPVRRSNRDAGEGTLARTNSLGIGVPGCHINAPAHLHSPPLDASVSAALVPSTQRR
eukprot:4886396-Pyramimonas_sp.AAC.2